MVRHWSNAFEYTCYGELPVESIYAVADRIAEFIEDEGLALDADRDQIGSAIVGYLRRRAAGAHALDIVVRPRRRATVPEGWTPADEQVWREWIGHHFTLDNWQRKVMYPVFGTNRYIWEEQCDGWREEIFAFLHLWVMRSWEIMDTVDSRQLPSPEEIQDAEREEAARRKRMGIRAKDVDPYLAEQEERRGKGRY
jgi:hypothetical protein